MKLSILQQGNRLRRKISKYEDIIDALKCPRTCFSDLEDVYTESLANSDPEELAIKDAFIGILEKRMADAQREFDCL